jgi:hypothetical protein
MTLPTQQIIENIPDIVKAFKDGSSIHTVAETFNISPIIVESIIRVVLKLQPINGFEEDIPED